MKVKDAARRSSSTAGTSCVGTLQYIAPELMRMGGAKLAGEASDVYSYSMVLWGCGGIVLQLQHLATPNIIQLHPATPKLATSSNLTQQHPPRCCGR